MSVVSPCSLSLQPPCNGFNVRFSIISSPTLIKATTHTLAHTAHYLHTRRVVSPMASPAARTACLKASGPPPVMTALTHAHLPYSSACAGDSIMGPLPSRSISLGPHTASASADGKLSVTDGQVTISGDGENGSFTTDKFSAGFKQKTFTIDSLSVKVGEVEHKFADGSTEKLTLNASGNVAPLTFALTGTKTITKTIKHSESKDSEKITMDPVAEYKLETPEYPIAGSPALPLLPNPPYSFAAQDKVKVDVSLKTKQGSDEATLTINVTVSCSIRPFSVRGLPVPAPPDDKPADTKPKSKELLPGGRVAPVVGSVAGGVGGAAYVGGVAYLGGASLIGSEVGAIGGPAGIAAGAAVGFVGGLVYWGGSAAINAIWG